MAAYSSADWMELQATGPGFQLPATGIEFKVPVSITPTGTPGPNQIGYTLTGTTAAVAPIALTSGVGSIVRQVSLTEGTWLLNAVCNAEAIAGAIDLTKFELGFAGTAVVTQTGSELTGTGIPATGMYGTCVTCVFPVVGGPIVIDLDVRATFTPAMGASFVVDNVDSENVFFTATRLS